MVWEYIKKLVKERRGGFLVLLDPDSKRKLVLEEMIPKMEVGGVDAFLIGGSTIGTQNFDDFVKEVKNATQLPVILFPGCWLQVSKYADAILFLSLISGRNATFLISEQVRGAPTIKRYGIETIPTGYILIDGGKRTSVMYMSNTSPIPIDKPEIAKYHCLAAEYLGMRLVYLDAGSGAKFTVPEEMISEIRDYINLPIIVGGGIREPEKARAKIEAGANFVVIGNAFEEEISQKRIREFSLAIHRDIK
jgi:phosphoglycerol geranylgeranyltransferase